MVILTNLISRTVYRFKVHAKNGVSEKAEMDGFPSRFAKLDVTTLESGQFGSSPLSEALWLSEVLWLFRLIPQVHFPSQGV